MRRLSVRSVSLLRVAIVTALFGHWVANLLFDHDQYAGAAPDVLGRLQDPILVQTGMALVAVMLLSIRLRRHPDDPTLPALSPQRLLTSLLVTQLLLFVAMEASERLVIEAMAAEPLGVEAFGTGFIAELFAALGSALVLAFLGETTKRIVALLRTPRVHARGDRTSVPIASGTMPQPRTLAGAGGVRAPPS